MSDWQRLDELLERGLAFYGRQLISEAIQCWREVLYLAPGHRLALEYLEAAGVNTDEERVSQSDERDDHSQPNAGGHDADDEATSSSDEQPLTLESLSALTVELIRERRLEEALALLYTARNEAPKDQSISRSINVIKQHLLREYRTEIGDLGQIPYLAVDDVMLEAIPLSDDEREVLRLIDGIVAVEDVVQSAGLGALQIHRLLVQLLRRRLISLKTVSQAQSPVVPDAIAPARRELSPGPPSAPFRPTLVPKPVQTAPTPPDIGPKLMALPLTSQPVQPTAVTNLIELATGTWPAAETPSAAALKKPSAYTAYVAEAVRSHLQGKRERAKELLALCEQECPDDPASRRNLVRLRERLGFGKDWR